MGWLARLFGSVAKEPIAALSDAFDKIFTSDEEKLHARIVLERLAQQPHILQAEINKIEAAHRSLFVAGWRPFIGWVCGMALMWSFIGHPIVVWFSAFQRWQLDPPTLITDGLLELVLALLGLGGLRTAEKLTGRSR